MADDDLQLPAGINDERSRAVLELINRLGAIDLAPLLVYRIDELPDDALHFLAWQFHVMGEEGWELAETPAERRALIRRALELHRYKGTAWSVREAVRSLGYAEAEIVEGLPVALYDGEHSHAGVETYGGGTRWAMFRVILDLGEDKGLVAETVSRMVALINAYKNVRSHLIDVTFRASSVDEVTIEDVAEVTTLHTARDVTPWGRRYDGSIDHDHGVRQTYDATLAYGGAADHSGWGEVGERYAAIRDLMAGVGRYGAADRIEVTPHHDGRFRHSGITYGEGQPPAADTAMPIVARRAYAHDGRYRYSGDIHDGAIAHDGARRFYEGIRYSGAHETHFTVI